MAVEEMPPFRGNGNAMPLPEATMLKQAISQLRKVVASERPIELTTEYLV